MLPTAGLKLQDAALLHFWGCDVQGLRGQGRFLPGACRGEAAQPLPASGGCWHAWRSWACGPLRRLCLCSVHSRLLLGRGCLRIPPLDTDPIGADQAPPDSLILIVSQRPRLRTRSDSEVPGRGPHLVNGATFRPARVSPPASSSPSCVPLHGRLLCPASLILCAPPWPPCPPSHLPPPPAPPCEGPAHQLPHPQDSACNTHSQECAKASDPGGYEPSHSVTKRRKAWALALEDAASP